MGGTEGLIIFEMKSKFKEFFATSWSIDNKTSIYVLTFIIALFGMINYNTIPKEQIPEIVIPTVVVTTVYPGTSPEDMENLVTRPLEKNMKSINGVKKITSRSIQDFSMISVEFNTGIEISEAKQKVKDAVDKTKSNRSLPDDLKNDPNVMEIELSEFPIMNINVAGNYDLPKLKEYAKLLQDKIESFPEITRVDLVGALDREIQVNIDMFKMQAASVTFRDVENAIAYENMTISGGSISMKNMSRSVRIVGEFKDIDQIKNITFTSSSGAIVTLKDIAEVKDDFLERESFSRINSINVITLNVIKKSGKNLLDASDKIKDAITELQASKYPKDLKVQITGDQSHFTRNTLKELNNTIIIGFILVTIVLMFFMGLTNAIFVGLSVPLSMALAYIFLPTIGFTMNMLVMFSFIFALGIVVDDAIVVIENTHRIFKKDKVDINTAAKRAAGEVFMPILSGTLTTLAPFVPLAFWPGVVGSFMFFIPITLIITLFASLIVAYIINPVFAVDFMTHDDDDTVKYHRKKVYKVGGYIVAIAGLFYIISGFKLGSVTFGIANFVAFIALSYMGHNLFMYKVIEKFQKKYIPAMMNGYDRILRWSLHGKTPYRLLWGTLILLFISFFITGAFGPKVVFFPDNDPNNILIYAKLPVGTDVYFTDSVAKEIENKVYKVMGKDNPDVESVVTNVALNASDNNFDGTTKTSNKAKISINFVESAKRINIHTSDYMDPLREAMKDIPGAEITVEKNKMGPPTGKPINIEVAGEDLPELISTTDNFLKFLESLNIAGIEKYKTDFEKTKPEILIDIDRMRANHEGITTAQAGSELRTAIFGTEASKFREGEDQFPIQIRYKEDQRKDIDKLMNLKITYRDMNSGMLRQIPLSSVATIKYQNSVGGINRTNLKRVITITSNVSTGYTANEIIDKINNELPKFEKSDNIDIKITGEQEDQKESTAFLGKAMLLSLFLILFILISQFNSIGKTAIILSEVFFSLIGVLLGFTIFRMPFSIIMTGMGVVALAGIVVRNGILLVEFTDVMRSTGMRTREAIIQAGKTRITPVILTAAAAILGLIPLAMGFNIDFASLLTDLNPHIHFGGDNKMFFGPLANTIIFGLTFATFLTLILIPVMYFIAYSGKLRIDKMRHKNKIETKRELEEDELNEY
jgi:multidrug efflux pump subunit AcrB